MESKKDELTLSSPMGVSPMVYSWPLKKGKGSLRRSEDKQDEAAEIVDTIRWVCEDICSIKDLLDSSNLLNTYNPNSFESMTELCNTYNKAVDKYVNNDLPQVKDKKKDVSRAHLRHIIQKCYNKSVSDPNLLNHYEAFTPEVYGETSFELICQILDKLHPIGPENKFVDLGSGVGQVVLQVAALSECSHCLGIEKSNIPAKYAQDLEKWFRFWMDFYGKKYSDFKIVHGDFLDKQYRSEILESTIVFVNNFAFGPEVDQQLKYIFAELNDGARIFSSKSFCALNFRISERNLSDIGTIMHVSKMDPLKGSVSWTGKPVSYYLHVIDRAKLERFFLKNAASKKGVPQSSSSSSGVGGEAPPGTSPIGTPLSSSSSTTTTTTTTSSRKKLLSLKAPPLVENSETESSAASTSQGSRSSSAERDSSLLLDMTTTRKAWSEQIKSEQDDPPGGSAAAASALKSSNRRKGPRRTVRKELQNNVLPPSSLSNSTATFSSSSSMSSNSSPPHHHHGTSNRPPAATTEQPSFSSRPIRAAVANAAAISALEGQDEQQQVQQNQPSTYRKRASRLKRPAGGESTSPQLHQQQQQQPQHPHSESLDEKNKAAKRSRSSKISGLDFLYSQTLNSIRKSNEDRKAPAGCINLFLEKKNSPEVLQHEEIPVSLNVDENGDPISYELKLYLQKCKKNFMDFMATMKEPDYKARVSEELVEERKRRADLLAREKQLTAQVDSLLSESLSILRGRLRELSISASTPAEFIEKAKGIVAVHHELQNKRKSLDEEVKRIQEENEALVASKEKELSEQLMKVRGYGYGEANEIARRELESVVKNCSSSSSVGLPIKTEEPESSSPSVSLSCIKKEVDVTPVHPPGMMTPLLNKLSDVTFTKCPPPSHSEDPILLPLNKRLKEMTHKQRHKISTPESAVTIEARPYEKTPLVSSRGVEVRRIESSSYDVGGRSSNSSISPSKQQQHPPSSCARLVDLPKIDLAQSMQAVNGGTRADILLRPDSRSNNSGGSEESNHPHKSSSKVCTTTPRAEQFQDRLKTIIHSVLSADEESKNHHHHSASPSPRLPPPPIQQHHHHQQQQSHHIPPHHQQQHHHHHHHHQLQHPPPPHPPHPPPHHPHHQKRLHMQPVPPPPLHPPATQQQQSSRTMNDLIQSEIEKSLSNSGTRSSVGAAAAARHHPRHDALPPTNTSSTAPSSLSSSTSMSRMSRVIEDSIRSQIESNDSLEGLACPRSSRASPDNYYNNNKRDFHPQQQQLPPAAAANHRQHHAMPPHQAQPPPPPPPPPSYQMEGLAARYYEQSRKRSNSPNHPPPHHTTPPLLPPKKQHLEERTSSAYRHPTNHHHERISPNPPIPPIHAPNTLNSLHPKEETQKRWQDEISTGFDRLVAYATEVVDKRRKSSDSGSPGHLNSPSLGAGGDPRKEIVLLPPSSSPEASAAAVAAAFDNRMSTLGVKFKGAAGYKSSSSSVVLMSPPLRGGERIPTPGSNSSRAATPVSGSSRGPTPRSKSPLPGENLPEHHPKKRYFAESRHSSSSGSSCESGQQQSSAQPPRRHHQQHTYPPHHLHPHQQIGRGEDPYPIPPQQQQQQPQVMHHQQQQHHSNNNHQNHSTAGNR